MADNYTSMLSELFPAGELYISEHEQE